MDASTLNIILTAIILLGATVLPFILGTRLRRSKPNVLWIGLLLCFIFGPAGQVYVEGWIPWFLVVLGVCVGAQQFLSAEMAMLAMVVVSPLVMYFRMRR
ncbi:hypothetical protein [Maridesulfovibrio salexigens]|uniref:Uncharacterized protein n=1 Tax=Maridesulfovibrio salexigens (strain ATCC 14822 / DSM 2638 / NCIMB 8403 / VKM B-1763) TaxID=526222 RepID=C6BVI8_MARSD|nr:hypothetical protein [Maridesulfovibrio salexigens]ACS78202.1 hypothetical protein Desal_0131 [Maridesulfovibrio salexigens DSM 2638]